MEKIIIYIDTQGRVYHYQNENITLTQHEVEQLPTIPEKPLKNGYHIYLDGVFSFGYELNMNKCYARINDIKSQLSKLGYLDSKVADGEDMTKYGDYKSERITYRAEINRIEELINLE